MCTPPPPPRRTRDSAPSSRPGSPPTTASSPPQPAPSIRLPQLATPTQPQQQTLCSPIRRSHWTLAVGIPMSSPGSRGGT
ncbi:hypothetical protein BP00DRAFT_368122 [Aspergillus indologenus CBS 114.80]|uniref:Uncharacterized protein n=1 Tax=Aspergillus indologenus CBS 114.80 TaxID=1450541 RepID=A0A2V5J5E8_9EURO|nr:hypothetical protein BP00DRAFT_368122 [Aspergillus indologenus CBS 114.80]